MKNKRKREQKGMEEDISKKYFVWRFSLFFQMLVLFLIITIPLLLASFWLNKKAERTSREQMLALSKEQMEGAMGRLDEQIMTLCNLGNYICSNSDELDMLVNMPEALTVYERGRVTQNLQQQFVQIKMSTSVIQDIRLHLKDMKKTMSTTSLSATFDASEYHYLMRMPLAMNQILAYEDRLLLFFTSGVNMDYLDGVKDSSFFLVIEFSPEHLMHYIEPDGEETGSASLFICENGEYEYCRQKNTIFSKLPSNVFSNTFEQDIFKIDGTDYIVLKQRSDQTGLIFLKYIDVGKGDTIFWLYRQWLIFFIVMVVAAIFIYTFFSYHKIKRPMEGLVEAFRMVQNGNFDVSIHYKMNDEFRYLYDRFNQMVQEIKNLIEQVYEHKILSQRAELKQLQSQINPHFLFNSLFIISVMARKGDTKFVEKFAAQLGTYFQFIVKNPEEMIPLRDEVEYARLYANIQMTRFSNRIVLEIEDPPDKYRMQPVPRLIIQPLIENALAHGLEKKKENGRLRVYFQEEYQAMSIFVEDNAGTMTIERLKSLEEKLREGTAQDQMSGLLNIHRRIAIHYGNGSGLELSLLADNSLQVRLKLQAGGKNNVPIVGG